MFAQVTNPAIDPIREDLVMSLYDYIGREGNILEETPQLCHTLKKRHPIVTNWNLEKLRRVSWGDFLATTLPMLFRVDGGEKRLQEAVDSLCRRASLAIKSGYTLLILSDRGVDEEYAPIPTLLALSAVHNHLVREKTRNQVALIVETGEPREVMHFALLVGYGASAINPYLAIETLEDLHAKGYFPTEYTFQKVLKNYIKAVDKGLLKVLSKMGISTLQSYCGAQIFEAIGLNKSLVERYFTGHVVADRRRGAGSSGARSADAAQVRHAAAGGIRHRTGNWRQLSIPRARRTPHAEPAHHQQTSAGGEAIELPDLPGIRPHCQRAEPEPLYAARPAGPSSRRSARAPGGSGTGRGDCEALRHRRHVFRVHQQGGARNAGHRHESHRRALQHRRGRRR